MNRTELQQLAEDRLADAQILLEEQRWSGAYYIAGYALECGLKVCVLAYIERTGVIFEKGGKDFVGKCWTHKLNDLVDLSGLTDELNSRRRMPGTQFGKFWSTASKWGEESRYQQKPRRDAEDLIEAITHNDGVLLWIKTHW